MHLAVYAGTEAQAIVHVHPPMVLAFSLTHDSFVPVSFEEKYTIGEVPIIPQDTPTVTKPEKVVEALKYNPVVIIKGHGTVAIGKTFQEAFLLTDLLEEAVHCQFFKDGIRQRDTADGRNRSATVAAAANGARYALFSREHMDALVDSANGDRRFSPVWRRYAADDIAHACIWKKATWHGRCNFIAGEITELSQQMRRRFSHQRQSGVVERGVQQ